MMNKKMISMLMVGVLSSSLLVGCQSTQEEINPTYQIEVTQEENLRIAKEIERDLPYDNMKVILLGTCEYQDDLQADHTNCDHIEQRIQVKYIFSTTSGMNFIKEREKVVEKMKKYYEEVNEKYNPMGVEVSVKIVYKYRDEFYHYYLITNDYVYDHNFTDFNKDNTYPREEK